MPNKYMEYCECGNLTTKTYARAHNGNCKKCATSVPLAPEERDLRIMEDYGSYQAYQREEDHYGSGN